MKLKKISLLSCYEKMVAIGFSTPQQILFGVTGWLFVFSAGQDISRFIFSPLAGHNLMIIGPMVVMIGFVVLPLYLFLVVMQDIRLPGSEIFRSWKLIIKTSWSACLLAALFLYVFFSFALFIFFDMFTAISESCLGVVASIMVLTLCLQTKTPPFNKRRRYTVIAFLALTFFSLQHIEITTSKSFVNDLYKVKRGMSGVEVENLLSKYLQDWDRDDPGYYVHLDPTYTGESSFRFTQGSDFGWGKIAFNNGRVIGVEFIPAD